jgi:hypothetical protein
MTGPKTGGRSNAAQEFGNGHQSAADIFSHTDIRLDPNAPVTTAGESEQGSGSQGPIFINPNSAFSNSSGVVNGNTRSLNIGPYEGGSFAAQNTILAHELGHKINAIPADRNNSTNSNNNTNMIVAACQNQLGQ